MIATTALKERCFNEMGTSFEFSTMFISSRHTFILFYLSYQPQHTASQLSPFKQAHEEYQCSGTHVLCPQFQQPLASASSDCFSPLINFSPKFASNSMVDIVLLAQEKIKCSFLRAEGEKVTEIC
jgi:hypothetical protein